MACRPAPDGSTPSRCPGHRVDEGRVERTTTGARHRRDAPSASASSSAHDVSVSSALRLRHADAGRRGPGRRRAGHAEAALAEHSRRRRTRSTGRRRACRRRAPRGHSPHPAQDRGGRRGVLSSWATTKDCADGRDRGRPRREDTGQQTPSLNTTDAVVAAVVSR